MKRDYLLLFLIPILLFSCEEMVTNVDVPQSESHFVIHAYLSPEDSVVTVSVSKSSPVFGNSDTDTSWLSMAQVFINGYELPRVFGSGYTFSAPADSFSVVAGNGYTVALHVDNELVCSGSCTVPLTRNESFSFDGLDSVQIDGFDGYTYYEYYMLFSFTDIAGELNFYRIGAELSYIDNYSGDTLQYMIYPQSEQFIRDIQFDGENYSGRLQFDYMESFADLESLKLVFITSDDNYYFYHRAILSQNGDDPFSEPVIIPTNVDNGLGCISGLRMFSIDVY